MKYQVILPKRIKRKLDKIEKRYYDRILFTLEILSNNPYLGKKLGGDFKEFYSYRVYSYRIIYEIRKRELVILIIRIRHRRDAYKSL